MDFFSSTSKKNTFDVVLAYNISDWTSGRILIMKYLRIILTSNKRYK